jgi:hypothetical protein
MSLAVNVDHRHAKLSLVVEAIGLFAAANSQQADDHHPHLG